MVRGGGLRPLRGPGRAGPPRAAGRIARRRGPRPRTEVREDPVDDRRLGQEGEDPHGTPATGADQRVDLEDPAQQLGPPPARLPGALWSGSDTGAATSTGDSTGGARSPFAPSARRRIPRVRLAYQPE